MWDYKVCIVLTGVKQQIEAEELQHVKDTFVGPYGVEHWS